MGLLEQLFGADGIGGQPGAVGNAVNSVKDNGILPSVLGGVGKVIAPAGNLAVGGMGDWLADVVTKNPMEVLKNPTSVLNDRGQISLTRLLFPEYRRQAVAQKKQEDEWQKARLQAGIVNAYDTLEKRAFGALGDQGQAGIEQAIALGVPQADAQRAAEQDALLQQQLEQSRDAVGGIAPGIPRALLDTGITEPGQGLDTYLNIERSNAMAAERAGDNARAARAEGRAIAAEGRAEEGMLLRKKREKRLNRQAPIETPAQKFQRELKERGATKAHDTTYEQTTQGLEGPISMISDPAMQGQLREQAPAFAAKQAEKEALKIVDEQVPPNSRKNLATRKAAREAIRAKRKEAETAETAATNPASDALPADPQARLTLANQLATDMLASGMPPDKVVNDLLKRGFAVEEIPE